MLLTALVVLCVFAVAGAAAWVVLRPRSTDEPNHGGTGLTPEAYEILSLSWEELEALLREGFERQNYRVFERGAGNTLGPASGLADMVLERKGKRWFVSAKYWRENPVPGQAVPELYGAMVAAGAAGGYIVTYGNFGPAAKVLAKERQIDLLDGTRLSALIDPVRKNPSELTRRRLERAKHAETTGRRKVPCPLCGKQMQRRQERAGPQAGQSYYACSDFPRCKGRRGIG